MAALAAALGPQGFEPAQAKEFRSLGNEKFHVDLPEGYTWNEKMILLPTHEFEQRVTANEPYNKWTVGLTIDEVVAESLNQVASAKEIAERIANVERSKDGNVMTEVIAAARGDLSGVPADVIEYRCDTTRGFYHYLVRVALSRGKLYNVTAQVPEDQWQQLQEPVRKLLDSMRLDL